jgi:para-nitrobenzyl esterase
VGLPNWPLNEPDTNQILEFKRDGKAVGETDPTKARLDVIEKAFKNRARIQTRGGI